MGIYYSAEIVVGLPYDELEDHYNFTLPVDKEDADEEDFDEGFYEWYEGLGLSRISPYYDAGNGDCLIGISVICSGNYSYREFQKGFQEKVEQAEHKFYDATGLQGKVYLTPHGG